MADPKGFLTTERVEPIKEPAQARVRGYGEFERRLPMAVVQKQGGRCMSCGVPFCHTGCPLGNDIPAWNDLVHKGRFREAAMALYETNNFPEVTGRVCPAPCEAACVEGIHDEPVSIKAIERAIADEAMEQGWFRPRPAERRTGKSVAIVGSGPAGLACAQQLARAGHEVVVIERSDRLGGLLRYGIPDFKLEKSLIDQRIAQLRAEGVKFQTGVAVGEAVTLGELRARHDAVVLATGSSRPRDLPVPGRELAGVHFAMTFLEQQNRAVAGDSLRNQLTATGKRVVILGGGDTGSDCLGTSLRQGAASVVQIELAPRPPHERAEETPWPLWPLVYRTSSSQEEGGEREFAVLTKRFVGDDAGHVKGLVAARVEWVEDGGRRVPREVPDGELLIHADLVLLALGYLGPDPGTFRGGALAQDDRGNVAATTLDFQSSTDGIFVCGDARRGQSLVVWAIWEGREAARAVDLALTGESRLPTSPFVYAP